YANRCFHHAIENQTSAPHNPPPTKIARVPRDPRGCRECHAAKSPPPDWFATPPASRESSRRCYLGKRQTQPQDFQASQRDDYAEHTGCHPQPTREQNRRRDRK